MKVTGSMKVTDEQIKLALEAQAGNISGTAQELNVTRNTIYNHINSNPELMQVVTDARESLVDYAESGLLAQVEQGNMTAIAYVLNNSREAKARGWSKSEPAQPNLHAIQHEQEREVMDEIKAGNVKFDYLEDVIGNDYATELFERAGVPVANPNNGKGKRE